MIGRRTRGTWWLSLITLGLALVAWVPAAQAAPNGRQATACTAGLPDLVVTDADVTGRPFAFHDQQGEQFTWRFTASTKNVCRAAAVASRTGVRLTALHHAARDYMTATRAVPALAGGESGQGTPSYDYRMRAAPADAYGIEVCADVTERVDEGNELNNCRDVRGHLYIANRAWKGSLNGSAPVLGSAKETWRSTGARLNFEQYLGGGTFTYDYSGDVTWQDSGSLRGVCTVTGGPATATTVGEPEVIIDYDGYRYGGALEWRGGTFYKINVLCPGGSTKVPGPGFIHFLDINNGQPTKLSKEEELVGSNYNPGLYATWHWNFLPSWKAGG